MAHRLKPRNISTLSLPEYLFEYLPFKLKGWYGKLHIGERQVMWCNLGVWLGCAIGFRDRLVQDRYRGSDCLTMVTYEVPVKKKEEFEGIWNDQARLCQRATGYEWTTMYKSLAFNQTPFSYACFRMWFGESQFHEIFRVNKAYEMLDKKLNEIGIKQKVTKYKMMVDDSSGQRYIL